PPTLEIAFQLLAETEDLHFAFDDGGIADGLGFAAGIGEQRLRFGAGRLEESTGGAPANAERKPDDRSRDENAQRKPHNEPQGGKPGHGSISQRGAARRPRVSSDVARGPRATTGRGKSGQLLHQRSDAARDLRV